MHKALGRGLESLIPSKPVAVGTAKEATFTIPVDKIKPNRYQPRRRFNEEKLKELSASIKKHGLAQPLLVSPAAAPGEYELIAGERRWRASKMAGLKEVIAVVRASDDKERFHLALIENIQREDLNPIEEAKAYRRLSDEFHHTQEELAEAMGKDRSVIANAMRLLNLPDEVRDMIESGIISAGHGRILAGIDDRNKVKDIAHRITKDKLTVRDVEKMVADWKTALSGKIKKVLKIEAELLQLAEDLQHQLGTKVLISGKAKKGKIEIHYFSIDELERIAAHLKR